MSETGVKRRAPKRGAVAAVFEHLHANPGIEVTVHELSRATGFDARRVQNAISYLRNGVHGRDLKIDVLVSGSTWRYMPGKPAEVASEPAPTGRRVFEEVGPTASGDIIIQDTKGALYRARLLD